MTINRNTGLALILILLGSVILLDKIGFGIGGFMSWIFPIILLVSGFYLIKNRGGIFGWVLIILGGIILFGKLAGLLGWLIAIVMILYGVNLLKSRSSTV